MKKISKIAANVLIGLLLLLMLILVVPRFFKVQMFSVLSGSMEPAYSVGDLIYVVPTEAQKIKEGDPISFMLNDSGTVVTHRVVEVDREMEQFYTKGDANELSDGNPVNYKNIIGKVKFSIPVIGYLIGYMSTIPGRIITITILAALIILILLLQRQGEEEEEEEATERVPVRRSQNAKRKRREPRHYIQKQQTEEAAISRNPPKREPRKAPVEQHDKQAQRGVSKEESVNSIPQQRRKVEARDKRIPETKPRRDPPKAPEDDQNYFTYIRPEKRERVKERSFQETEQVLPLQPKNNTTHPPLHHSEEDKSYEYERLQICWKMITLMERMWNETVSTSERYQEEMPFDAAYGETSMVDWLDEEEEGGIDNERSREQTPLQKISEKKKKTSA